MKKQYNLTDEQVQELRAHMRKKKREGAETQKDERELITNKLSPPASFIRGIQVGGLLVGGVNTIAPGQFGVADWPLWVRLIFGGIFLMTALNYLLTQRGWMRADALSVAAP